MPRGLLCITVTAKNADDFLRKAAEAGSFAPAIELRFDSLEPSELSDAVARLSGFRRSYDGIVIGTLRSSGNGQGGYREIDPEEIELFWRSGDLRSCVDWVDAGPDELPDPPPEYKRIIRSFHSFEGTPEASILEEIRKNLLCAGRDSSRNIAKIACSAADIGDAAAIWKLLDGKGDTIPIAMGRFGVWTRILGSGYGSPLSYAALNKESSAAPGQIGFSELREVYRADSISERTGIYGVVGSPVDHSLSPVMHNAAFRELSVDSVYLPFAVMDAGVFFREMVAPKSRTVRWNLKGFSVTHPHKIAAAGLVDELESDAAAIGAVNTVRIENGKTIGSNTDAEGFLSALRSRIGDPKGAAVGIIGSGGAARAASYALSKAGARVVIYSRSPSGSSALEDRFGVRVELFKSDPESLRDLDVIVNASPLGSDGELAGVSPIPAAAFEDLQLAFDMVYNPVRTRFLRDAEEAGIPTVGGLEMLIEQAALQFLTWTGLDAPKNVMREAAESRLRSY